MIRVENIDEVREAVCAGAVLPVAGQSKPALWRGQVDDESLLDVSGLSGLIDYDPAELTFTALAATPVAEVSGALAEHGQYLPFDPPLVERGATLAGSVAAGASGPRAFRYGGIRDFVIGVQFVDGTGRLVAAGEKVVKNAAGFDLSKLMVGSIGRLGVMTRLSFKVFPRPRNATTLIFTLPSLTDTLACVTSMARGPLQLDALDIMPDGRLLVRLGGDPESLPARARRCTEIVGVDCEQLEGQRELDEWSAATELRWISDGNEVVRVALSPARALELHGALADTDARVRFSLGANVAWVAWPEVSAITDLDRALSALRLSGMRLTGDAAGASPLLGAARGGAFAERVRSAIDPEKRFGGL